MQIPTRKQKILIALLVYLLAVVASVNLLSLKRDALRFHQKDYNYFVEQAARLTDPGLANSYALQIEGYNFLGLQGVEGVKSLYHAVHTAYFRYIYVFLFAVFKDPLALFLVYSLVFFSPILYYALIPHPSHRRHALIFMFFTLLYLVFPASLNSVTADLRPRVLFAAAWSLVILSIYYERPFWEKILFFVLLVGLREEGVILGAIVILLNHLLMDGRLGRWKQTVTLLVIDVAALLAFLAFMRWGEYTRIDSAYNPLNFIRLLPPLYWVIILVVAAALVYWLWSAWKKKSPHYRMTVFVCVYALAVALAGFQWLRDTLRWVSNQSQASPLSFGEAAIQATTNEMTALVFYMLIVLGLILWDYSGGKLPRLVISGLSITIVLFLSISLIYYPPLIREWRANVAPARLVWDFAASHDRYATRVMLDYDTYQAFYNYDQVIVYNRLPVWDTLPQKRYYPANKSALVNQIQKGMDYAVISRASLENVLELAELAQVPLREIAANDRYVILQFHPPSYLPPPPIPDYLWSISPALN
jgi:hypothetical protein